MFLLYNRKLQFGKKLFLVFLFGGEDAEDDEEDGEEDEEEEPERADDDDFVDFRLNAFVFDVIDDVEDAEAGSFRPGDAGVVGIAGHNPEGFGVFFVGEDFFVGEKWVDLEGLGGGGVNVAFVGDGRMASNVAGEEEARNTDVGNVASADGFAGDFGVDEVDRFKDFVDAEAFLGSGVFLGADNDRGVLTASGSVGGDMDAIRNGLGRVWSDGAFGLREFNPSGHVGVVAVFCGGDVLVFVFREGVDAQDVVKVRGVADGVDDGKGRFEGFSRRESDEVIHRGEGERFGGENVLKPEADGAKKTGAEHEHREGEVFDFVKHVLLLLVSFVKVGAAGEALSFVFLFEVRESGWKLLRGNEKVAFTELVELLGLGGKVDEKLVAHNGEFVLELFRAVIVGAEADVEVGVCASFGDDGLGVGFEGHEVFDADGSQGIFAGEDGGEGEVSFFWSGGNSAELGVSERG